MKILEVISSLHVGGAEKLIVDLVPRLRNRGFEVDVCLFDGCHTLLYEQLSECGCKIYSFSDGGNVYNPLNIIRLSRLMRKYDIVHTHNTAPQLFAAIGSMFCSVNLFTTEHSTSNRRRVLSWYRPIDQWMYSRYNTVVCISDQAKVNLEQYLFSSRINITTVYNGVDVQRFKCTFGSRKLKKSNKFVFVMVAGFRYQKDQETLIRTMALLPKEDFELWLVGDGEKRKSLEVLVKECGVESNVMFWGLRFDIPEILQSADVVVMSSHFEGLSLASIEGMSVGKPFIASDVHGLREITEGAGILFPQGDSETLKEILIKLKEDKNYYYKVSDSCWQRANQYDIQKTVDGYSELYYAVEHQ